MSDWASDDVVHDAARAIQGVTPEGYGLNFKEACDFARAALSAVNPYEWRPIAEADSRAGLLENLRLWNGEEQFVGWYVPSADQWIDALDIHEAQIYPQPTHFMELFVLPPSPEGDK